MSFDDYHENAYMINIEKNINILRPFFRNFNEFKEFSELPDKEFDKKLYEYIEDVGPEGKMKFEEHEYYVRFIDTHGLPKSCDPPPWGYYLAFWTEDLFSMQPTPFKIYLSKLKLEPVEYDWMSN